MADAQAWYAREEPRYYLVSVGDTPVGYARTSDWQPDVGSVYVGLDIHEAFRGMKIAKMAYRLLMRHLREVHGMHTFWLKALSSNQLAREIYTDLGFVPTGQDEPAPHRDDGTVSRTYVKRTESAPTRWLRRWGLRR